jgi:anti-anti-sigma factor
VKPPDVVIERVAGGVLVVRLTGEHDVAMAPYVRQRLELLPEGVATIVVDLTETSFLDSTVLAELILARRRVESVPGGRLAVVVPRGGAAAGLFDLVDADRRFFPTFESREAAITGLRNEAPPRHEPSG